MKVTPIPLFEDNYSYLLHGTNKQNSLLVDPADADAVYKFLMDKPDIIVTHILLTHKHWDHAGGVPDLIKLLQSHYNESPSFSNKDYKLEIVSGSVDNIPNTTVPISDKSSFNVNEIKITCIPTPCHTRGAICYYLEDTSNNPKINDISLKDTSECYRCVFTGDTIFIGGCGRFFEGTPLEMVKNFEAIMSLPDDTFIYCGHEYTIANLEFALGIEWENSAYEKKLLWAKERRDKGLYTIPSTITEEKQINIFARYNIIDIQKRLDKTKPEDVMSLLREYKNNKVSLKK